MLHRAVDLRVFENGKLGRIFGPESGKVTDDGHNYVMGSFIICTLWNYHMKENSIDRVCSMHLRVVDREFL
jgi:hypothetical protein